jgi:hypothetical protein
LRQLVCSPGQGETDFHLDIQYLPGGPLVFRKNAVDNPHSTPELQTTNGQIEYPHRQKPGTGLVADLASDICCNPTVLSVYTKMLFIFIHDYPAYINSV